MIGQRKGKKIINIASVGGDSWRSAEFQAIGYHASKGGGDCVHEGFGVQMGSTQYSGERDCAGLVSDEYVASGD